MFFKSKESEEQRNRVIAYKKVFSSPEGKTVLFDLMNKYYILNPHKGEPYQEGQRSVVLEILHQTKINLEELNKLIEGEQ